jgi:hypothetical protein
LVGTLTVVLFAATQVLIDSFRGGGVIGLPDFNHGTYASYPGGAHNIYGTFQATISLFTYDFPHRLGLTFVRYPAQSVPTGVLAIFDLPYLPLYGAFLGQQYKTYLGGSYILNPYFADFGQVGIVLAGVLFAVIAYFAQQQLIGHHGNYAVTGIAAVVVVGSFRAFWYTQIAWIDTLQGFMASLVVYFVAVNLLSFNEAITSEPMKS